MLIGLFILPGVLFVLGGEGGWGVVDGKFLCGFRSAARGSCRYSLPPPLFRWLCSLYGVLALLFFSSLSPFICRSCLLSLLFVENCRVRMVVGEVRCWHTSAAVPCGYVQMEHVEHAIWRARDLQKEQGHGCIEGVGKPHFSRQIRLTPRPHT